MNKGKAIFFNDYMLTAKATFEGMLHEKVWGISEINGTKIEMNEEDFQRYYEEFIEELKGNILEYQDIQFMDDYLVVCFSDFIKWDGFSSSTNKEIINGDFEVKFLRNLKHSIEKYRNILIELYYGTEQNPLSVKLREIFHDTLKTHEEIELEKAIQEDDSQNLNGIADHPDEDERFYFSKLKEEADKLNNIIDKIKFVTERLYDLEQWELQNDILLFDKHSKAYYKFSTRYYPNFKELCKTELMRYDKLLEIDKRKSAKSILEVQPDITNDSKPYKWAMSGTDFLELFTALYQNECFERKDGKSFTRKQLTDYFQGLFGLEIKDLEGKLTRATNRNDKTPFLNDLISAFEIYADQKEKKLKERK